jgi:hypothetical protein
MNSDPPFLSPPICPPPPPPTAYIERKGEFIGSGCLLQAIGLCVIWFFPIGTFIGLALLIGGSVASRKWICSECGTILSSRRVKLCPACHSRFT